jgi:hypothetical protein
MSIICGDLYRGKRGTLDIKQFWIYGIQRDDVALVNKLWSYKPEAVLTARFTTHYGDNVTALQLAVTLGHTAVLLALLSFRHGTYRDSGEPRPAFSLNQRAAELRTTVLHKAAYYCNLQSVVLCLQHGANPLIPSRSGSLPHHISTFRACEQRKKGDDSRYGEYMAITRRLLRACQADLTYLRGHLQAVQQDDLCAHKPVEKYDDNAKAFLQEAVRLNAEEAAIVAVATPAAAAPAAVPAAAAAAAAAEPMVLQPFIATAGTVPAAVVATAAAAAGSAHVHSNTERLLMQSAATATAGATAVATAAAGNATVNILDSYEDSGLNAAGGSSSSSSGGYFTDMLNNASSGPAQLSDHAAAAAVNVHSSVQYSSRYSAQYGTATALTVAHSMSTTAAAAASLSSQAFAAAAAPATTAYGETEVLMSDTGPELTLLHGDIFEGLFSGEHADKKAKH